LEHYADTMHFTSSVKTPQLVKDYGMRLKSMDTFFKLISGRDGREIVQEQTPIQQSEYQKSLDLGTTAPRLTSESVRYWSDYNRVYYHPRSIVQLNEYDLNSQTMPFEDWNVGEELFKDLDKEYDLLDRDLRPLLEECDHLRALQLFSGSDDAWGGFAAQYMERLRDEFGKKSIWMWAIEDGTRTQRVSDPVVPF
jgi:Tubulin